MEEAAWSGRTGGRWPSWRPSSLASVTLAIFWHASTQGRRSKACICAVWMECCILFGCRSVRGATLGVTQLGDQWPGATATGFTHAARCSILLDMRAADMNALPLVCAKAIIAARTVTRPSDVASERSWFKQSKGGVRLPSPSTWQSALVVLVILPIVLPVGAVSGRLVDDL